MKYLLKWILYILAFVPLLVNLDTLFPFIFTKSLLIRTAVTLFWVLFAVYFFTRRREAKEVLDNNWRYIKNPLYVFVCLFMIVLAFSTVFAVNQEKGYFGDIERGEGFLGILHFFAFFVAALLVFKKEDWATFFRFNLITGAMLLFDSVQELATGEFIRAQSLVGNPTFLAGYFLFVTFSASLAFFYSKDRAGWRIFSFLMVFGGIVGVFLTGTRGAILGLLTAIFVVLFYFAIKGKDVFIKIKSFNQSLQRIAIALLVLAVLSIFAFISTSDNVFWQKIPGLNRFTNISLTDSTFQTRAISAGISFDAINPAGNGLHRLLIGYGWENFNIAYNKHYNPEYMRYESLWFDRAHNKLLDVLVMTGVLGLIVYLGIWYMIFYLAFKKVPEKEVAVPIIFFGSAYFVQSLFVFDQISTYIPVFAFWAFAVFASSEKKEFSLSKKLLAVKNILDKAYFIKLPAAGVFFAVSLVMYTFIPYRQSVAFIKVLQNSDVAFALSSLDFYTKPYNYAQPTIRNRLLTSAVPFVGASDEFGFVDKALALHKEFVEKEPYDPRDISLLGTIYRLKGNIGEPNAYAEAEKYFLMALELSPKRQDHLYNLATLYSDQGNFVKMQEYAWRLIEDAPTVPRSKILYASLITREGANRYAESVKFLNEAIADPMVFFGGQSEENVIRTIYSMALDHFFNNRDEDNFLLTIRGLRDFEVIVDRTRRAEFEANLISSIPLSKAPDVEDDLNKFIEGGFDALVN